VRKYAKSWYDEKVAYFGGAADSSVARGVKIIAIAIGAQCHIRNFTILLWLLKVDHTVTYVTANDIDQRVASVSSPQTGKAEKRRERRCRLPSTFLSFFSLSCLWGTYWCHSLIDSLQIATMQRCPRVHFLWSDPTSQISDPIRRSQTKYWPDPTRPDPTNWWWRRKLSCQNAVLTSPCCLI